FALPFLPMALMEELKKPREGPFNIAFLPDSKGLVLVQREGRYQRLYRLNLDGGAAVALTTGNRFDLHPAVSPDGQTVVFSSAVDNVRSKPVVNLYAVSIDGSNLRR